MPVDNRVLFIRPRWADPQVISGPNPRWGYLMYYMYWMQGWHVDFAEKVGFAKGVDMWDLKENDAVLSNVEAILNGSQDPALVIHGSHGNCNIVSGQNMTNLFCSDYRGCDTCIEGDVFYCTANDDLLSGRTMVTHACLSAQCLGPTAVDHGCNDYVGEFLSLYAILGPEPAFYSCGEILKTVWQGTATELLSGNSSTAGWLEERDRYDYWINWLTDADGNPRADYPEAQQLIGVLNKNRYLNLNDWTQCGSSTTPCPDKGPRPDTGTLSMEAWRVECVGGDCQGPWTDNYDTTKISANATIDPGLPGEQTVTVPEVGRAEVELPDGNHWIEYAGKTDIIRVWGGETTGLFLRVPEMNLWELTTSVDPAGAGMVDPPGGMYVDGKGVELTATANTGYEFDHWSGDASGSENPTTVTMDSDKSVTAHFTGVTTYTLDVSTDPTGGGSVELEPLGPEYEEGTEVTLTAVPEPSYDFVEWTGDVTGTNHTQTVIMNSDKSATAHFSYSPELMKWSIVSGTWGPTADFTWDTEGLTVYFEDLSSVQGEEVVVEWLWTFGDGESSTEQSPAHEYAERKPYPVTLKATDETGDTDEVTKDVVPGAGGASDTVVAMAAVAAPLIISAGLKEEIMKGWKELKEGI